MNTRIGEFDATESGLQHSAASSRGAESANVRYGNAVTRNPHRVRLDVSAAALEAFIGTGLSRCLARPRQRLVMHVVE